MTFNFISLLGASTRFFVIDMNLVFLTFKLKSICVAGTIEPVHGSLEMSQSIRQNNGVTGIFR